MGLIEKKRVLRSVIAIKEAHKRFVKEGLDDASSKQAELQNKDADDITDKFWWHIVLPIQVGREGVWKVFRNGLPYKTLEPGPHILWNTNILGYWNVLRINMLSVRLKFLVDGRVRGPRLSQGTEQEADDEMALNVKAVLSIVCRMGPDSENLEHFLDNEEPIDRLFDMMNHMMYEML